MNKKKASALKLFSAFAAVYIIWGSTYLGIRFAIETIPPFIMAGTRFIIAGLLLLIFAAPRNKEKLSIVQIRSASIIGVLLLVGGNGGVTWAEQFVPSGLTALLISTVPVWVVLISWAMPKESRPTMKNVIGVILGFIGLFFLVSPYDILRGDSVDLVGAGVLMCATLSWSLGSVYSKHALLPKLSIMTTSIEMLAGGLGLMIVSFIFNEWSRFDPFEMSSRSLLAFVYLIIFGSIIAYSAYIWLLEYAGPSRATTYAYVNPVVAVLLGWLLAGEELNIKIIFSAIIIIAAVVIIITNFGGKKKDV